MVHKLWYYFQQPQNNPKRGSIASQGQFVKVANGRYHKDEFKTESEYEGTRKSSYAKFIQKLPTVDEIGESTASLWTNFNAK